MWVVGAGITIWDIFRPVEPDPEAPDAISSVDTLPGPIGFGKTAQKAAGKICEAGEYLAKKAPKYVTPGTKKLEGQYVNDLGRVEPWKAHYDDFGRQIGRTDYNAGNKAANIPNTHYSTYEYNAQYPLGRMTGNHIPGEYQP